MALETSETETIPTSISDCADDITTNNKHFPLLDLPPELLHQILIHVVTLPGPICLHPLPPVSSSKESNLVLHHATPAARFMHTPSITRVNKLLRAETLPLFYRLNDFHGLNWASPRPEEWLKGLGEVRRGWLRGCYVNSGWKGREVVKYFEARGVKGVVVREVGPEERRGMLCVMGGREKVFSLRFVAEW